MVNQRAGALPNFKLEPTYDPKRIEERVRDYWDEVNMISLLRERNASKVFGYVEGPPTLNGMPHIGHVRGRIMKDLWHRHQTMRGVKVLFNGGWDTQGLPVELEAERELGLRGSKSENLKLVGEAKLVETCKSLISKYHGPWLKSNRLIGLQMDDERAYWTYKDEYIEREWKYLEAAHKQGLLGEGFRVVPYCPSCQTSLSHEEVGLGYETVQDPSVYYKVKLVERNAYLIVWTTMPFTVVTDELVGVHPDETYLQLEVDGESWVVGQTRYPEFVKELHLEGKVTGSSVFGKGEELEGLRYVPPLLEEVPGQKTLYDSGKVHVVVSEDFVDVKTGSGIVHLSPANGEEDFDVATRRNMPIFNPLDDSAIFTSEAGKYAGMFARDSDDAVIQDLRTKGLLLHSAKISHDYPLCWRSGHRLVYMARRAYFYWVDRIVDRMLAAAQGVEYFYDSPRNRFLNIVREGRPWNISRERVWGAPLPVWVCSKCGEKSFLFSRKEILESASQLPDGSDFELHRPWIDRVVVKCKKCGGDSYREPFVLDTWHNSGASPFASMGESEYKKWVPVPFLTEGIDQTRGWAYSLLVENVLLSEQPQAPYKAFLFQGHVLDDKGEKMSKSKGNSIDALELLGKYSADLVRFYLLWKAGPADSLSFSLEEMGSRPYQVLNTLYHMHLYFAINSSYDSFSYTEDILELLRGSGGHLKLGPEERWLISRLNGVAQEVGRHIERCRYQEAARALETFLIDTLSQQYVPMTRSALWDDSEDGRPRRMAIYAALGYSLSTLDKLLHPLVPFLTEYLHKAVFGSSEPLMLLSYPEGDGRMVDPGLDREMAEVFKIVSLANAARMKAGLKRRWPLRGMVYSSADLGAESKRIVMELANVQTLSFAEQPEQLPMVVKAKLTKNGAKKVGRLFSLAVKEVERNSTVLYWQLSREGSADLRIDSTSVPLERGDIEFSVEGKEGYQASAEGKYAVAIDISRDSELLAEGLVRDVARRLQALRKQKGYSPTEVVDEAKLAGLDAEAAQMVERNKAKLLFLVRAKKLSIVERAADGSAWSETDLDGKPLYLYI